VESNFPKHKEKFKTYSQLPAYVIAELRDDNLSTYEITWTMFKNDVDRDEVEISFKKNKSAFNRQDLTVSTRKGTKPSRKHMVFFIPSFMFIIQNPKV
jgi:hypothetical protein